MAMLNPIQFTADKFFRSERIVGGAAMVCLFADASSLGLAPGALPFGRLYDDSADVGCALRNPTTDFVGRFFLVEEVLSDAGDVVAWEFAATSETINRHRGAARCTLTIYNS